MRRQTRRLAPPPALYRVRLEVLGRKILAGTASAHERLEHEELAAAAEGRAKPVRRERADAAALARYVATRWYAPGLTCHSPEMGDARDGMRRQAMGGGVGWPDYTLVLPFRAPMVIDGMLDWPLDVAPLSGALELKSAAVQPQTARGGPAQRGGLSPEQAWQLRSLQAAGWRTCVAYGWQQAAAALDSWAGERPSDLPQWWADGAKGGEL